MFRRLKQRLQDMRTIARLCSEADQAALREGSRAPGAEHFLLAALALPDGSARRAFARISASPDGLVAAIAAQYGDALRSVGAGGLQLDAPVALGELPRLHQAQASGQSVLRRLAVERKTGAARPLVGADVVAVIAAMQHGVAARALRALGADTQALAEAARAEAERT